LSACNTAAPSGQAGETGLSGLAQAFFYAGAQSMLVSHWPVFDDIAPELVLKTLSLSQAGLPRAEAFQQAMREVRNDPQIDAAHPAIWAPFVLVGEGR
jgi:CHAT domain-containing protein